MSLQSQEYDRLVREMESNGTRTFQILSILVTFSAAVIGFAVMQQKNAEFFVLIPNVMVIPVMFLVRSQLHSTFRIATYISKFIEGDENNIYYEQRMKIFRKQEEKQSGYYLGINFIFGAIGVITFGISTCLLCNSVEEPQWIIFIILLSVSLFFYVIAFIQIKQTKDEKQYIEYWKKVAEKGKGHSRQV